MSNEQFLPLAPFLAQLGIMLTLSLVVERLMAILNWLMNQLIVMKSTTEWEGSKQIKAELQHAKRAKEEEDVLKTPSVVTEAREIEPHPNKAYTQPESRFDVKFISPPKALAVLKEFWIQIIATFVAILGCYVMKFSIWVFIRWAQELNNFAEIQNQAEWWEFVITGVIIGAGSKPVNFLMNFIINRKIVVAREETVQAEKALPITKAATAKPAPLVPAVAAPAPELKTVEDLVGFTYSGGDRPARLEHTHLFRKPIDLIVYHHTAMHSEAPFEEVIKEFDRKGWLTGYNCVIMKDGTIHALCRWDRFGNHARGYNAHSLGVALHGNFEPNPRVPFSNPDGRYGILKPTLKQVESAARITALWSLMHNIEIRFPTKDDPEFPKGIVPHYELAPKACPGGNFPHDMYRKKVRAYAKLWGEDDNFKLALEDFKASPMVIA